MKRQYSDNTSDLSNLGKRLSGWVLRSFTYREQSPMLMLFKSIVLPRIEYGSQLWCPHLRKDILALEKPQRFYTKHIDGLKDLSYKERLSVLNIYSLERRRERYLIIYIWKILENIVPNFSDPIVYYQKEVVIV